MPDGRIQSDHLFLSGSKATAIFRVLLLFLPFVDSVSAQDSVDTVFSTYYGGTGTDDCDAVAVDNDGNSYLGCHLNSSIIPGSDLYQYSLVADMDAFIVKLNAAADKVEYITHLGGSGWDAVLDLTVDEDGNVYAVGGTYSSDFSVTGNAMQPVFGGHMDVFITKLSPTGEPLWTSFFGGSGEEESSDIHLGNNGIVHIIGYTDSADLVTSGDAIQTVIGGETDAFVASFDSNGRLLYSTYLGGNGEDRGTGIDMDLSDHRFITGSTNSEDFPIVNGLHSAPLGNGDAFVAVIDESGSQLEYSTYFGGNGADGAVGIGVNSLGHAIIAGGTNSTNLETVNGSQESLNGRSDVFVAQINLGSSELVYSSYLGGNATDRARKLAVDSSDRAIVVGQTSSADFPMTVDLRGGTNMEDDGFIAVIDTQDPDSSYAILSGGTTQDNFEGIALGRDGTVTVSGVSNSSDYPLVAPLQREFLGGRFDVVVARFALQPDP